MAPRHPVAEWIIGLTTAAALAITTYYGLISAPVSHLDFVWRPFAAFIIAAMVANVILIALLNIRVSTKTGTYFWLVGFLVVNLAWLGITLLQVCSRSPELAMFWQGISPLPALIIPPTALYFILSYVDDNDFPASSVLRLGPLLMTAVLLYVSSGTELIESHRPHNIALEYWGWQSDGGPLGPVAVIWGFILMVTGLAILINKYRQLRDVHHRRQVRIFITGLAAYFVFGIGIDFSIYYTNPHILPQLTFVYTTIMAGILSYGILRYGLLRVNAVSQSTVVLEKLAEGVIGITPRGTIEFVNTTAEILLGMSRDQLAGRVIAGFFPPETYQRLSQLFDEDDDLVELDDATILDERRRPVPVNIKVSRLRDGQRSAGFVLVIQNVTELRLKAQELEREKASVERKVVERTRQLRDEQAKLKASIEGLNLGFALVDSNQKLLVQNQALHKILGLPHAPASLAEANHQFNGFDLPAQCRRSQTEARPIETNDVSLGSKILRVFTAPVHTLDDDDIVNIGTVILIEDFTEARVLERSRDEFFSIASHELRTPLTAIKGNATMLGDYYAKDFKEASAREMLEDIHDSSQRLIEIVNDFLDLSRLEQGKMSFRLTAVDVPKIIEQVAYEMKPILREKHLKFSTNQLTLDALPLVQADSARVKQILYNLIGNAAIHTQKGGITVSADADARTVTVHVADTGSGISVESQKFLFHKFQQAANSILTRDSTRGTGLGLYISKLLVEHMGGSIQLDHSTAGKGSSFSFTLPRADKSKSRLIHKP